MGRTHEIVAKLCGERLGSIAADLRAPLPAETQGVDAGKRAAASAALQKLAASTKDQTDALAAAETALEAYQPGKGAPKDEACVADARAVLEVLRRYPPEGELWTLAYGEAGEWTRHYSTVRATVTTFLLGLSIGIVSFGWAEPRWGPFAVVASVVWLLMLVLMGVYSWHRATRWWHQQVAEEALGLRAVISARRGKTPAAVPTAGPGLRKRFDWPVWVVGVLTIAFVIAIGYRCATPPEERIEKVEIVAVPGGAVDGAESGGDPEGDAAEPPAEVPGAGEEPAPGGGTDRGP